MEIAVERAKDYILALKQAGSFSVEDIANMSGIPLQTVRNILSGKTPDARFGTIAKLVISMGGDLNELVGTEKKKEVEINSMVSLKETYEMRIADIIRSYDVRIEDIKAMCEQRLKDKDEMCELRLADNNAMWEARYNDLKEMTK